MRLHRLRRTPHPNPPPQGGRGLSGLRRRRESHRHSQQKHVPLSRANCPFKANFSSPQGWGEGRVDQRRMRIGRFNLRRLSVALAPSPPPPPPPTRAAGAKQTHSPPPPTP